jgi:hypothetical protein
VVFSSMGCFYDGAKGRGLRAVLAALAAAGFRRAESDRAADGGAGSDGDGPVVEVAAALVCSGAASSAGVGSVVAGAVYMILIALPPLLII